jgi:pSer/pThr/pTyr-binding forkhead associated (FHA) protein
MDKDDLRHIRTVSLSVTQAVSLSMQKRVSLLVYHRRGVEAVPLVVGESMVVGREAPARIRVDHPSLSRQHARFEIGEDGVHVQDLGSTNGTRVNGRKVDRCLVKPGDEVLLGSVRASLHTLAPTAEPIQGLLSHDRFLSLLEDEVVRHRTFHRKRAAPRAT